MNYLWMKMINIQILFEKLTYKFWNHVKLFFKWGIVTINFLASVDVVSDIDSLSKFIIWKWIEGI